MVIWFFLSAGTAILITQNYMVEPRYLVHGLIPLAGLGSLGLEFFMGKIKSVPLKEIFVICFITLATLINFVTVRLMPYELDRHWILKSVNSILETNKNAIILVPYAYTDFNFLRVMTPEEPIYNVDDPEGESSLLNELWRQRLKRWYGNAYIDEEKILTNFVSEKPVYYLGWRKYPPVEFVKRAAESIGIRKLSEYLDALPLKNHLSESWVWNFPAYNLKMAGKCGQYEYYRVTLTRRKGFF
jgi:hypothetical protein